MRIRTLATISIGLLSAACQAPYNQNGSSASYYGDTSPTLQASNQACVDYGFRAGTTNYDQCVSREQAARSAGRVNRNYEPAMLNADARNACSSYGLSVGTPGYDRCVTREIDARSYRDAAALPAASYRIDQYGNRVDAQGYRVDANGYRANASSYPVNASGYRVDANGYQVDANGYRVDAQGYSLDANGYRIATQTYPTQSSLGHPYSTSAAAGQAVSRDEFGNRYDAQGNRVDSSGRIIPMRESLY